MSGIVTPSDFAARALRTALRYILTFAMVLAARRVGNIIQTAMRWLH